MPDISSEDRAQLELFSRAAFSNPFGQRREQLDLELVGGAASWSRARILSALAERLRDLLGRIMPDGCKLTDLPSHERRLTRDALGFLIFHEHSHHFDALIELQLAEGGAPKPLPGHASIVADFHRYGFAEPDIPLYLAWFFQMRRAFYFIARDLLGVSPCMQGFREALWNNLFTHRLDRYEAWLWSRMEDFSTLLLGDTGTGKGIAAAAIGRAAFIPFEAKRRCFAASFVDAFVSVNLSQFPEALIESELFGHRKGAFTGAVDSYDGALQRCNRYGAIFLDEIGEVSIPVQIKLLRVLQERVYQPVGSHEVRAFRGRVVAATHQPLDRLREEGRFRDDFYYRLCADRIHVPSLRQRIAEDSGELQLMVSAALRRILGESDAQLARELHDAIVEQLGEDYPWPGNVRELEQCVRRMLISGRYEGDFRHRGPLATAEPEFIVAARTGDCTAKALLEGYCRQLYQRFGSYEEVARRTQLDRRTVKKYVVEDH